MPKASTSRQIAKIIIVLTSHPDSYPLCRSSSSSTLDPPQCLCCTCSSTKIASQFDTDSRPWRLQGVRDERGESSDCFIGWSLDQVPEEGTSPQSRSVQIIGLDNTILGAIQEPINKQYNSQSTNNTRANQRTSSPPVTNSTALTSKACHIQFPLTGTK